MVDTSLLVTILAAVIAAKFVTSIVGLMFFSGADARHQQHRKTLDSVIAEVDSVQKKLAEIESSVVSMAVSIEQRHRKEHLEDY